MAGILHGSVAPKTSRKRTSQRYVNFVDSNVKTHENSPNCCSGSNDDNVAFTSQTILHCE